MNIFTITACSSDIAKRVLCKKLIEETRFEEPQFFNWPWNPEQMTGREVGTSFQYQSYHIKRTRQGSPPKNCGGVGEFKKKLNRSCRQPRTETFCVFKLLCETFCTLMYPNETIQSNWPEKEVTILWFWPCRLAKLRRENGVLVKPQITCRHQIYVDLRDS